MQVAYTDQQEDHSDLSSLQHTHSHHHQYFSVLFPEQYNSIRLAHHQPFPSPIQDHLVRLQLAAHSALECVPALPLPDYIQTRSDFEVDLAAVPGFH